MHSLIGKMGKDPQFGKDTEFRSFYGNKNENGSDYDIPGCSAIDKNILDLDMIVEKWISYMWEKTKTKQVSKYELDELDIIVDWKKVEITQEEAIFEKPMKNNAKNFSSQTLFRTYFTNSTDQVQEYSFKTERVTRQSCSFSFVKGFSREKEGAITFKIPYDVVEIGAGIKSEQSIECGKDKTNEEEISWGVDSLIKVNPNTKTRAELVISEIELDRNFTVYTYLKGRLNVILNSRKDDRAFVKSFSGDIVHILTMAIEKLWVPSEPNRIQLMRTNGSEWIKIECSGKCKFRLGIEQHVNLTEERL